MVKFAHLYVCELIRPFLLKIVEEGVYHITEIIKKSNIDDKEIMQITIEGKIKISFENIDNSKNESVVYFEEDRENYYHTILSVSIDDIEDYLKYTLKNKLPIEVSKNNYVSKDHLSKLYSIIKIFERQQKFIAEQKIDIVNLNKFIDELRIKNEQSSVKILCESIELQTGKFVSRDEWSVIDKIIGNDLKRNSDIDIIKLLYRQEILPKKGNYLFYIDLNNLGGVNSELGESLANIKLERFTKRVLEVLSDRSKLVRKGGDEFLIFVKDEKEYHLISDLLTSHSFIDELNINDYFLLDRNYEELVLEIISLFTKYEISVPRSSYHNINKVATGLHKLGAIAKGDKIFFDRSHAEVDKLENIMRNLGAIKVEERYNDVWEYEKIQDGGYLILRDGRRALPIFSPTFCVEKIDDGEDLLSIDGITQNVRAFSSLIKTIDLKIGLLKNLYRSKYGAYSKTGSLGYHIPTFYLNKKETHSFIKSEGHEYWLKKIIEFLLSGGKGDFLLDFLKE